MPSCADCQKWMYDPQTWQRINRIQKNPDGALQSLPVLRPPNAGTPCCTCPKSHDGLPHPEKELSSRNYQAYWFYIEACAVNQHPDDRLYRRNAGVIRWVEQEHERSHLQAVPDLLLKGLFKRR